MVSVVPGTNLFQESVEKVFRNQNLHFQQWAGGGFLILDSEDIRAHKHWYRFGKPEKLTRVLAHVSIKIREVLVYRREDLGFAKRLAENISSAAGVPVTFDLSEHGGVYYGCGQYCYGLTTLT